MIRLALKMLFGDTVKFLDVRRIARGDFLMTQENAEFCELMSWTKSTLRNVPALIWVVEDKAEQVNETNHFATTNFNVSTVWLYVKNNSIPISFGATVTIQHSPWA
jgi:hypothetical protein